MSLVNGVVAVVLMLLAAQLLIGGLRALRDSRCRRRARSTDRLQGAGMAA